MSYQSDFNQAESYYVHGQYSEALCIFKRLYKLMPSNDCLNYIGCTFLELGEYNSSVGCFESLIEKCPNWERPVFNLGRVYLKTGDEYNALKYFNRARLINPNNEDVYYYLGVYYEYIKEYETAIKYYLSSIKIEDKQPEVHLNLGVCYMQKNLYREALNEFDLTLYYDQTCQSAIYNQALVYKHLGEFENAIRKFIVLYQQNPRNLEYLMSIETCYSKMKDWRNALYWNNKILEVQPDDKKSIQIARKLDELISKEIK